MAAAVGGGLRCSSPSWGGAKKVHEVDDEAEVGRADVPGV
eukprot:COSAG03_NODE_10846_length_625_cov_3.737569_2_plen_39_part_01